MIASSAADADFLSVSISSASAATSWVLVIGFAM
ncbi:AMP nucleosidase [Rhodobacterales bacterium HTCC2654]|uniref:AMP nucleosidase n=1 Tax=Maritimibacter alkaliphilus HTCC2654 TaxID=314271 RepID=A3VGY1_9RHOB|nr:AMP nucleosidase [Rhodobacterales bacterium HTCC2654] [Maritimibacter alkaliphilus HTCC2654]